MIELWEKKESGILLTEPLLLRACMAGHFGKKIIYPGGCVCKSMFTYLLGEADPGLFDARPELFFGEWLICMSLSWESFLRDKPKAKTLRRVMMKPGSGVSKKTPAPLSPGYTLSPFTPEIFSLHPFGHCRNYQDFDEFCRFGSGAVILFDGKIVSSASSFLTFQDEVELDVSTDPGHRRSGLADHCVARMMSDCTVRGMTIHWDAQNEASMLMAVSHGFEIDQDYAVYLL